jgi:lysophospholipase L1-like esterase
MTSPLKKNIIFSLFSILLFFLVFEIVLRLTGFSFQPIFSSKPGSIDYGLTPSYKGQGPGWLIDFLNQYKYEVSINSYGFRGPEIERRKKEGTFRIITLGDSCTFGHGLKETETYPARLQQILQTRSYAKNPEVINAGIPGTTSRYGLNYIKDRLIDFQPDLFVVSYGWNDMYNPLPTEDLENFVNDPPEASSSGQFFNIFRTYQFINKMQMYVQEKRQRATFRNHPENFRRYRVALPDFEKNLENIVDIARKNGIIPLFLTMPSGYTPTDDTTAIAFLFPEGASEIIKMRKLYNDAIRNVAARLGVGLVDPVARFESTGIAGLFIEDHQHPNPPGALIIAEEIGKLIDQLNLIPRR